MSHGQDTHWMRIAIALANRHVGLTAPNPSVGCVLVKENRLIASGVTARGGRPHAETEAIASATDTQGATAYVTLEPCAHTGETGPCAHALIEAGITRAVIACSDPDTRVSGKGIAMLEAANIEVTTGICEAQARESLRGFFCRLEQNRPFISLKLATTLDGDIATATGESQWITGERARTYGHLLRAKHDAILTGSGTFLADNPALTCRLPGREGDSPQPILLDRRARCTPPADWWHFNETISLDALLTNVAERGINQLLIEAGAELSAAFLNSGLVDRLYWFHAPLALGADGLDSLAALPALPLAETPRFHPIDRLQLGADSLTILEKIA